MDSDILTHVAGETIWVRCTLVTTHDAHVDEEVLEERPHVLAVVHLLHFHLRVHVAVVQEVDVRRLHLQHKQEAVTHIVSSSRVCYHNVLLH